MKIYYWKSDHGNFGDDLNCWIWAQNTHNKEIWNDSDDIIFVGIGTVLDNNIPKENIKVVLGSGAGYSDIASDINNSKIWKIYGVRGPLTADIAGLDPKLALTDPAILIANMERFKSEKKEGVIFIPHWKAMGYGRWEEICTDLGIEYISPCGDADEIIKKINSASLVLAESMHAAIIADALRTPWIAIATYPEIVPFKWADWSLSLDMAYKPVCLAPSSFGEYIRNIASLTGYCRYIFKKGLFSINSPLTQIEYSTQEEAINSYKENMRRSKQKWRGIITSISEAIIKRTLKEKTTKRKTAPAKKGKLYNNALLQMKEVLNMPASLSDDAVHKAKLDQVTAALKQIENDYEKGLLS